MSLLIGTKGIKPRLKLKPQIEVFSWSMDGLVYLILRSPVAIHVLLLAFFMGWRNWLSRRGLLAYWFILVPTLGYILTFTLVYLDPRYVAGSLVVVWMCLLASLSLPNTFIRVTANRAIQILALVFALTFVAARMGKPIRVAASDLIHLHESEWNLNWMLADRMLRMGLQPSDRIAWIGESIDDEWVRLLGLKIVAEVPVTWDRENTLFRRVYSNWQQIKNFWWSTPDQKAKVFQAFREAGVTVVILDSLPGGVDQSGWQRVLPVPTPHLPKEAAQLEIYRALHFKRIAPAPATSR